MKKISYDGIGAVVATFHSDGVSTGEVVKISEGSTVSPCEAGEGFCGVVFDCDESLASVQLKGVVYLPVTGTVDLGYQSLVADGNGGVSAGEGGISCLVVDCSDDGYASVCL